MQNDMTKGSPLRLIVFFTIPVLLGNIFQNVYNLMDSIIVGRFLGVNALAAVGATGTLAEPKPSPYLYDEHALIYYCNDLPHPTKEREEFIQ